MKAKIVLIRHGMTQGNQEHRYVGTTDEGMLPESVEELRGMQKFWQKQVSMNRRTATDSVHDEVEIAPGKITCEQHCQKNGSKSKSSTSARICAQSRRRIFCSRMQERWKSRSLQSAGSVNLNT